MFTWTSEWNCAKRKMVLIFSETEGKIEAEKFRNRTRKGKDRKENTNRKGIIVSDLKNINARTDSVTFNHIKTVALVFMYE